MTAARLLAIAVACAACAACGGDDDAPAPDAANAGTWLERLEALPGVRVTQTSPRGEAYTYVTLRFTQPVDHQDPGGATFEQQVSLLHTGEAAPMIVQTSGYWDYYLDARVELTQMLAANQISIEHRYFGSSRPEPADWSKLTIEQMANDQHAIIAALRTIYAGAFITTGGSKGGMTAIYHRRFFPDDVDGTVPYVAPLSRAAPDLRYAPFLDTVGAPACRQAVRDLAIEMLANRRAMLESRAIAQMAQGHAYTRVSLPAAVESAVLNFEWAFWQYHGALVCSQVPATSAPDDAVWSFLDRVSSPTDNADARIAQFEAYYHQAYAQLGYPDVGAAYLDSYLQHADADYAAVLPSDVPAWDGGAAMTDIDAWLQAEGDRLLFVYGEWDPWTAGKFELGGATDSLRLVQPQGSHGASIRGLVLADEATAHQRLAAWTGVTPVAPSPARLAAEVAPPTVRIPPAMVRALRAR